VKQRSRATTGLLFGVSAYLIWGSFPLIITASAFANPLETVVWRVVFGFLFAALLVSITKAWRPIIELAKSPKKLGWIAVAALFIFINWETYVIAVVTGNTIESSLGYFINPLITILFAVLILKEKLRRMQWVALGIGFVAVVVLTLDYGRPPWFAFILAFSFAIYSLAKNKVGNKIPALQSFTLESAIVMPVALIQLAVVASMGPIMLFTGVFEASVLIGFGILTAIPLILFGAAASRIPLASIGFIQYLTPTLQFLTAYFILQEPMPAARWIGFGLVWVSLAVLTFDALKARRGALPIAEQP
jgi:chloramphenicol-sensitive protein RarD